jgi:hypothetical protein
VHGKFAELGVRLGRQLSLLTKNHAPVLTFEVLHGDEFAAVGLQSRPVLVRSTLIAHACRSVARSLQ